jgi:hypothetical protein
MDAPAAAVARPAENLAATSDAVEIPAEFRGRMGALPFRQPVPGQPRAAKTVPTPVMRTGLGETADPTADAIGEARSALPFLSGGITVGSGVVPFPRLTLEQYASLRAELTVWPERAGEILEKYHVMHEAALGALDEHWRREIAEKPEVRAAFEEKLAMFVPWLRSLRR